MPLKLGTTGLEDMPGSNVADRTVDDAQYGTSITRVYISSQSPILSFGENTGQFAGNGK